MIARILGLILLSFVAASVLAALLDQDDDPENTRFLGGFCLFVGLSVGIYLLVFA